MEHIENPEGGFDIHILQGDEIMSFLNKLTGAEEGTQEFNVGDRVRSIKEPTKYGHISEMCDCPWATALGFRCIDVALHETCGGGVLQTKEHYVEHID